MIVEFLKFIIFSLLIVLISKNILVVNLRKMAGALNLKAKTIGKIAGVATSIPELLTVIISSLNGLYYASIYNILSSNIINLVQYFFAIVINKNIKKLKNKIIIVNLVLVLITILIPLLMVNFNIEQRVEMILIFLLTYFLFILINKQVHKINTHEAEIKEKKKDIKYKKIFIYFTMIAISGILLFVVGEFLGNVLKNLSDYFGVSDMIIGILLGFITSIPELITFFEAHKHNESNELSGVLESTNNLFTSNTLNLFIIQSIGIAVGILVRFIKFKE